MVSGNSSEPPTRTTWVYLWHKLPAPNLDAFLIFEDIKQALVTLEKHEQFKDLVK